MASNFSAETSLVLHKANAKDLFYYFYEQAPENLPKLLPQVYKRITKVNEKPPTFEVEYAQGYPIETETHTKEQVTDKNGILKISYKVTAGDVSKYYKTFNYTIEFIDSTPRGTLVEISYVCEKASADVGPALLEFHPAVFIQYDRAI